jgi:hypothetical protein
VVPQPGYEVGLRPAPGGDPEDRRLGVIDGRVQFVVVEQEKGLHGGAPHPVVAVRERMVLNQGKAERRRLLDQAWMQIGPAKGLAGQGDD